MKKSDLISGIITVALGVVCLLAALFWKGGPKSLVSLAVYCFLFGIRAIRRWCYWHSPANREWGREILESETIEAQDERNVKIRDRAGRYANLFGLHVIAVIAVGSGMLWEMGIFADGRLFACILGLYLVLQLLAEHVIKRHLEKRY